MSAPRSEEAPGAQLLDAARQRSILRSQAMHAEKNYCAPPHRLEDTRTGQ
jgi:hypothetical protein